MGKGVMMNIMTIIAFIVNSVCCFIFLEIMKGIGYPYNTHETMVLLLIYIIIGIVNFYNGESERSKKVKTCNVDN